MIRDEGACALAEALQVNQSLQELEWVHAIYVVLLRRWTLNLLHSFQKC